MTPVSSTHIEIDEQRVAWIGGTRVKVTEVVLDKIAYGWSPEEIHFQHPHLSLAQIHAALAYYYENQPRCDAELKERMKDAEALSSQASDPEFRRRLGELKRSQ